MEMMTKLKRANEIGVIFGNFNGFDNLYFPVLKFLGEDGFAELGVEADEHLLGDEGFGDF